MEKVCQVFKIKSLYLIKSKQVQKFDDRAVKPITHIIYSILTTSIYTKSLAFLLKIILKIHFMILR